jgi:CRISPR-associated endoribonuclease Cas6
VRLLLKLSAENCNQVSINNNYALSSAIYKILQLGSEEFAAYLHETGYRSKDRTYKLFTFSINFESTELSYKLLTLKSPRAFLNISSPLIDDFIKNFVIGTFTQQRLEIYSEFILTKFRIDQAEIVTPPNFKESMYFKMASPLVLSTPTMTGDKKSRYFFRYDDDINEIRRIFKQNLINKYEAIHSKDYVGDGISLEWDADYIQQAKIKNRRLSKKVSILKDINDPIDIIGIYCPFRVTGDPELIKIGYECGFGEKNSMGFGMVI